MNIKSKLSVMRFAHVAYLSIAIITFNVSYARLNALSHVITNKLGSQNIVDKIFQLFFTIKPTGEGTGLGLSLAYDIITRVHDGKIKVESKEGEGSTFIIQ